MSLSGRVVVLMGGPSEEHAISLKSGQGIIEALTRRGWMTEPLVIPKTVSVDEAAAWTEQALKAHHPDAVFIALHGQFGEDGTVQHICEQLHLAYTGSGSEASRLGMDKVASRRRFEEAGLPVPRWRIADLGESSNVVWLRGWSYPLVVKPSDQGSSIGVSLVQQPSEFARALMTAAKVGRQVLIEEFIAGRELTVGILAEEPLPVVEIRPKQPFFDFTAKYTAGKTDYLVPAPLSDETAAEAKRVALAAHQALGCRHLSRADLILNAAGVPVLLEVNTIPGFTPTSLLPKAAAHIGISYDELCERLIVMARHSLAHAVLSNFLR